MEVFIDDVHYAGQIDGDWIFFTPTYSPKMQALYFGYNLKRFKKSYAKVYISGVLAKHPKHIRYTIEGKYIKNYRIIIEDIEKFFVPSTNRKDKIDYLKMFLRGRPALKTINRIVYLPDNLLNEEGEEIELQISYFILCFLELVD